MNEKLTQFTFNKETLTAQYFETVHVTDGVDCDVYIHPETKKRDLGIITIQPGCKTPRQRVLKGDETIEGFLSGKGRLIINPVEANKQPVVYEVNGETGEGFFYSVKVGEIMQWEADSESELVAFEICYPPYQDGRYENL